MSEYKLGIYRKIKRGGELGKFCLLERCTKNTERYNLYDGRKSANKTLNALHRAMGNKAPYMVFDFGYEWYKEDFHKKYQFIKEGDMAEWERLEKERKAEHRAAKNKK